MYNLLSFCCLCFEAPLDLPGYFHCENWFLCTGFCTNFYLTLTENLYPVGLGDLYILASMKMNLETVSP